MASSIFYWLGSAFFTSGSNAGITGKITSYNGVATAGNGIPAIVAYSRQTAQIAADANVVTYTVGAADGTFEVSGNVTVTTATTHSFDVRLTYTNENNISTVLELPLQSGPLNFQVLIVNTNGAVSYASMPLTIRAKAATTIVVSTVGTFTTVVYNVEGVIKQLA